MASEQEKKAARSACNVAVRKGTLPAPSSIPCSDCGETEKRHGYDHHAGYAKEHWLDVQAVCYRCHAKRDNVRAQQTHCYKGHEFTPENTIVRKNGCRKCRQCRREFERRKKTPEWWRNRRKTHGQTNP